MQIDLKCRGRVHTDVLSLLFYIYTLCNIDSYNTRVRAVLLTYSQKTVTETHTGARKWKKRLFLMFSFLNLLRNVSLLVPLTFFYIICFTFIILVIKSKMVVCI